MQEGFQRRHPIDSCEIVETRRNGQHVGEEKKRHERGHLRVNFGDTLPGRVEIVDFGRDQIPAVFVGAGQGGVHEFDVARPATADLAVHMGLGEATPLEQAGLIDTKFGPVALFRPTGTAEAARACLGYLKRSEEPALQISGFSCQGDTLPARRAAIACTLNRLTLLTSGNEPKLAELFAHAELKRRSCAPQGSSDWLLGAANAQLRGAL